MWATWVAPLAWQADLAPPRPLPVCHWRIQIYLLFNRYSLATMGNDISTTAHVAVFLYQSTHLVTGLLPSVKTWLKAGAEVMQCLICTCWELLHGHQFTRVIQTIIGFLFFSFSGVAEKRVLSTDSTLDFSAYLPVMAQHKERVHGSLFKNEYFTDWKIWEHLMSILSVVDTPKKQAMHVIWPIGWMSHQSMYYVFKYNSAECHSASVKHVS